MVLKIIDATEAKVGTNITVDGTHCTVRSIDISKTGKHGHAKARIEAIGIITGVKKVFVVPGHEKFEVPMVDKRKAQVLSVNGNKCNVMDLENFESFDLDVPEDLKEQIQENSNVEYWDVEGQKVIKRVM
ncbi:translation initiation factor IF-5A [Candidatus Pacearchaeota archaeon]|nr:translation initiation factor IF-5A [Candidatus Pacearchaeota archaeon]